MVSYLDKQVGLIMKTLKDLGIEKNTVLIFLADNGTDKDLANNLANGRSIAGGKGTMTDQRHARSDDRQMAKSYQKRDPV